VRVVGYAAAAVQGLRLERLRDRGAPEIWLRDFFQDLSPDG